MASNRDMESSTGNVNPQYFVEIRILIYNNKIFIFLNAGPATPPISKKELTSDVADYILPIENKF